MSKHIILFLLLAGCSTQSPSAPVTQNAAPRANQPPPAAPVAIVLTEAGNCTGHTCTMHFAENALGATTSFTKRRCVESDCPTRRGQLTELAQRKLREFGKQLAGLKLERVYGSPGSADGPIYVALVHHADGTESKHLLDPTEPDLLPPALREAAELIEAVSDALGHCKSTTLVEADQNCSDAEREDSDRPIGRP